MHAVLNAAVPIVALIFTGYVCGRCGVSPPAATDSLNRFAIYLALPALMFLAMSRATPGQAAQLGFVLAFAGGIAITFALGFALSRLRGRRVATARIEAWMRVTAMSAHGIPLCLLVFFVFHIPPAWSRPAILLSALPIGSGPFMVAKLSELQPGVTSGAISVLHVVSVFTVSVLVAIFS